VGIALVTFTFIKKSSVLLLDTWISIVNLCSYTDFSCRGDQAGHSEERVGLYGKK
jgi:hypothetical protein